MESFRNQLPPLVIPPRRMSFNDSSSDESDSSASSSSNNSQPSTPYICDCQVRQTNGLILNYGDSRDTTCATWLNVYLRERGGLADVAKISFYFSDQFADNSEGHSLILRRRDGEGDMFGIEFNSEDLESQMSDYHALQQFIDASPNLDDRLGIHIRRPSFVA